MSNPGTGVATNGPVEAPVTAALVSHDQLYRDGVEAILEGQGFSVGFSAPLVKDFVRDLQEHAPPDVLILVGALPSGIGEVAALRAAREAAPNLRIIVFADDGFDPALLRRLVGIGVDALLPTDLSAEILVQSIRLVLLGEGFMFTEFARRLLEREPLGDAPMPDLTPHEIGIIRFVAGGRPNKAIAEWLGVTETAVKVQIRRLLRKIGASNRTQAAIWAMERGLVGREQRGSAASRDDPGLPRDG